MKKLMIAAVAVAMAACAQAYNVTWGLADIGDGNTFVDWDGTTIDSSASGVNAYLLALSSAADAASFSGGKFVIDSSKAMVVDTSAYGKDDLPGWGNAAGLPTDSSVATLGNEFQYFQMIFTDGNLNSLADGDHVYIMDAIEVQGADPTPGGTNWEYAFTDTESSLAKGGWNTVASVPEPTSGLLLLLGVAGLALKRRRA